MTKNKNPEALWHAYSALAGLVAYTAPEHRAALVPALNVILACLRDAGEACGADYPETSCLRAYGESYGGDARRMI
jgi:hypothetical protein